MKKTAELSKDESRRMSLTRSWGVGKHVAFLMFNPSTADAMEDDATIRKCVGFARQWGFDGIVVLNLYTIRGRDPRIVKEKEEAKDPYNAANIHRILHAKREMRVTMLVAAWGCAAHHPAGHNRPRDIRREVPSTMPVMCLGRSKDGSPRHPLMLPYSTPLEAYQL